MAAAQVIAPPLLEMRGIGLDYGGAPVLDGVDFELRQHEVHALLGENGAGKSSLMRVLVGAVPPTAGAMRFAGEVFVPTSTAAARRRGVVMVFQELTLLPHLTVAENLWLGRERRRGPFVASAARAADARRVLERLGRGDIPPSRRVAELAPADRQMVEIARAVLASAQVLVLDEPTSSLGAHDVARLFAVIRQLRDQGMGIVYISHALEEVRELCDRCTVLRDGRNVASGPLSRFDDRELVGHMAGRPLDEVFPGRRSGSGHVRLAVQRVAAPPVLREASLDLHAGEIAGIAGLAGAGRTELLRALFGLLPRAGGEVRLDGIPLPASPAVCWRRGVGMLAEDRKQEGLALRLPIATNVGLASLARHVRAGFVGFAALRQRARELGAIVRLRCRSVAQPVGELSGGNQQKVAIARLLHAGCSVLLLDEPTRGIDVGSRQEVYHLLAAAARDGAAILVVSSQLPELLGLCDRIAVMRQGRLSAFRPAAAWTQETLLHAAMPGRDSEAVR